MAFKNAYIPYGMYWTTPFCKWEGSFQYLHSIEFAADITKRFFSTNNINPRHFDELVLGMTIPQFEAITRPPGGPHRELLEADPAAAAARQRYIDGRIAELRAKYPEHDRRYR